MRELVLEKGKDYDFISTADPRYALRLSELFERRFSGLDELVQEAKKRGLDGEGFYINKKINFSVNLKDFLDSSSNPITLKYWPVEWIACEGNISKEVARIKPLP